MKQVNSNFKNNIKKYGRQIDAQITFNNTTIGKEDINKIVPYFNTSLFKSVMCGLEIDSNVKIAEKTKFNTKAGIKFNNDSYEYIQFNEYTVYSCEKQEDTESYKIIAYDKMLESMVDFDLEVTEKLSVREYIIKVFQRLGWSTTGISSVFINSTKLIEPMIHYGIGYTFRDVLDEIATITGSFICVINGVPTLRYITETNEIIDEEYLSEDDVTIGEKYFINSLVFSRAEGSDNIYRKDDTSIETNGLSEFKISDNQILSTNDRDEFIDELFNYLKTLEFYTYDVKSTGIMWFEPSDEFTISVHNGEYSVVALNDEITIEQDIEEKLYTDKPEESETEYRFADETDKKINQTYILVNKQEQRITQLASKQGEYDSKLTQVEQSVEEISQQVSEIADFTRTIQENNQIHLNETVAGEGYVLDFSIQGSTANFIYLAPKDGLTPSDTLVPLGGYFTLVSDKQNRTTMSEEAQITRVVLDEPLRNLNDVYDEFKIVNGIATVIRRIGVNSDLTLYALDQEVVEELGELQLKTFDTDTYIYVQEYYNLVYSAKYIIKNDYSENFVTNYEANSMINQASNRIEETVSENFATKDELIEESSQRIQTAQEITQEVSKKVGEDEIISSINQSAEEVQINANKISLEGAVTVNGGFEIDEEGNMIAKNGTFTGGNIKLSDDGNIANATLTISNDGNVNSILSNAIYMLGANENVVDIYNAQDSTRMGLIMFNKEQTKGADFTVRNDESRLQLYQEGSSTVIRHDSIQTPILYQTSLGDSKKNFEKLENGLNIIKATDIYKYNLKSQADSDKKHIGFVIGKNYKYSSEITAEDEEGKEVGVDTYSMLSVAYKAIQEQQEMIEKLQDKITKLEEK